MTQRAVASIIVEKHVNMLNPQVVYSCKDSNIIMLIFPPNYKYQEAIITLERSNEEDKETIMNLFREWLKAHLKDNGVKFDD